MIRKWGKWRWLYKLALALGFVPAGHAQAQNSPGVEVLPIRVAHSAQPDEKIAAQPDLTAPPLDFSAVSTPVTNVDPVSVIPNFFGGFVARGTQACFTNRTSRLLNFQGSGAEGFGGPAHINAPVIVTGPGGPYTLNNDITYPNPGVGGPLGENGELTPLIRANFPGATFVSGNAVYNNPSDIDFFYNYLFTSGLDVCVNLPNPAGGGLVGRNKYFDNGSPLPHDRVYFFYNHVGNFPGLGTPFDINRYVFGVEKTFFNGLASVEVRIPFAGTASSDQYGGQPLATNQTEFGNVGLVLKGVLFRTPNFVISTGMAVSAPTADDSRLLIGNTPVVTIQNQTWILQPLFGMAYAPNDRFYAQFGAQFDFDPQGNPVRALNGNGGLTRVGTLNDQNYVFLHSAVGYWIWQNVTGGSFRGLALQGELLYDRSIGTRDIVQTGNVTVADLGNNLDVLNATTGVIYRLSNNAVVSFGVSLPLGGTRLYDYNLIAQVNLLFGPR